jgi:predicted nucleotidyltransferase
MAAISDVFRNNPRVSRAVVFGSRAKGVHEQYSDVDIALYGDLGITDVECVACDLDELPLVYKFDISAYEQIKNPMLREHIDRVGIVVYEKNPQIAN